MPGSGSGQKNRQRQPHTFRHTRFYWVDSNRDRISHRCPPLPHRRSHTCGAKSCCSRAAALRSNSLNDPTLRRRPPSQNITTWRGRHDLRWFAAATPESHPDRKHPNWCAPHDDRGHQSKTWPMPDSVVHLSVPVDEQRYLALAKFWIDARGHHEGRTNLGAYDQDEIPVLQQQTIEGHAVRAMLLCSGLVAAGEASDRSDYLTEAQRLWNSMTSRRMYVTGGVGAEGNDEKFGPDYYLPNKTAYAETCAAVAAGFFDRNLNLAFADAKYADALERALFNGALAGVSLKGNSYFYDNPLEAGPQHERWSWHPCPCCPPMFLKLMGGLPGYIYAQDSNAVYVNQFVGSHTTLTISDTKVKLRQTTRYPWDGQIKIAIAPEKPAAFDLFIRTPDWRQGASSTNNLYEIVGRPNQGAEIG